MRIFAISFLFLLACQGTERETALQRFELRGETMGTTYSVIYYATAEKAGLKADIDQLLLEVNAEVSNWDSTSTVSLFNQSEAGIDISGKVHMLANYELAMLATAATDGAFDPTIMPLVNYYGFGYGPKEIEGGIDTTQVQRLLEQMGVDKLTLNISGSEQFLAKTHPDLMLDLGGSAKGYGVDAVSDLLTSHGVQPHFVEIGGEVRTLGSKPEGPWTTGVNLPKEGIGTDEYADVLPLVNRAVATSGNYRNFYREGGQVYSHTINPKTGFPERNTLLSASVLANTCGKADAFATACMVLGPAEAEALIESQEDLEAYFLIRIGEDSLGVWTSAGLNRPSAE